MHDLTTLGQADQGTHSGLACLVRNTIVRLLLREEGEGRGGGTEGRGGEENFSKDVKQLSN